MSTVWTIRTLKPQSVNMNDTLVSIVVPVYNAADTIAACIDSLCSQTHRAVDIVLVDDGSQDASGRICDEYAARDGRVRVLHQLNQGRTAARWNGTCLARGLWLTYVDADDCLVSHAVESLLEQAMADAATDIVLGNARSVGKATGEVGMEEFRHMTVRSLGTIGVPWGSLYRRSVLTKWMFDVPRDIVNGEDYIFWVRLVFHTDRAVRTLAESVYRKGDEHTCNTFCWTSDYCQRLNRLRMESIPAERRAEFLSDTVEDRLVNLFAVTLSEPRRVWQHHVYYEEIRRDMEQLGLRFSFRQRVFMSLPSRSLRRLYSRLSNWWGQLRTRCFSC